MASDCYGIEDPLPDSFTNSAIFWLTECLLSAATDNSDGQDGLNPIATKEATITREN